MRRQYEEFVLALALGEDKESLLRKFGQKSECLWIWACLHIIYKVKKNFFQDKHFNLE